MKLRFFELFDYVLLISMVLLICIGVFFIYSSGVNSSGVSISKEYIKQIIFACSGLILTVGLALFDYRKLKRWIPQLFILFLLALLYTMVFGRYVNGARSWIGIGDFGIQPSEFGKIIYILFLAWYLERSQSTSPLKRFCIALGILCVPMCLILLQPDLGTASVYVPIFLAMCFVAGLPLRYIMAVLSIGLITILFTVLPVWEEVIYKESIPIITIFTNDRLRFIVIGAFSLICLIGILGQIIYKNKYYYWITYFSGILATSFVGSIVAGKVLKDYQIKRLIVFIDPSIDPLASGWNIIQSKIAIGSGHIFGQGFLQGTQSHYRFLPQQSTDFIFSILSEEIGFIGSLFVFALFFTILIRIIFIMKNTKNTYGFYISTGILMMFFFHFVVNVGMVMGIMPITGIPLLFLSYGGSSLWTAMSAIGLLMSINFRHLDFS